MYVSSYIKTFRDAFDAALDNRSLDDHVGLVKKLTDQVCDAVSEKVREAVDEYLVENIKDDICRHAASVAESMLRNALAGNEEELRNLFGFNEWYMKHAYVGSMPTEWALLDALVKSNPDLFLHERLVQQDGEIALLREELRRLKEYHST